MNLNAPQFNPPANSELHPAIYKSLIGLTIWLVFSIWFLFDRGAYIELILAMITVLLLILTGIPLLIWLIWRQRAVKEEHEPEESFHTWAAQKFSTWTGSLTGRAAAVQILLPIIAVSVGMTLFGLIFNFTVPHVGS
jgi:hypothetical protein